MGIDLDKGFYDVISRVCCQWPGPDAVDYIRFWRDIIQDLLLMKKTLKSGLVRMFVLAFW